jgi:hypothetical protein
MRRTGHGIGASALLVALALAGTAQEQRDPAAAAQQQDRIEIQGTLDSWYKLVDLREGSEGKAVGYVHETLSRMQPGSPWAWTYDLTSEMDTVVPVENKPGTTAVEIHATSLRASLDDTFAPAFMDRQDMKGTASLPSRVFVEENARKIEVEYSAGERKIFPVNPDEEIFYSRFLMFIALRQAGALSRPGTRKAILMYPREDGTPPYAEVQIEIKESVKRDVMGKKDVTVTPITYLRPPPAPMADDEVLTAYIDRYGRIVEEESRRTRRVLVATEREALGDRPLIQSARRDPFRKDQAFNRPDGKGAGKTEKVNPNDVEQNLAEAKKLIDDLQKAKTEKRDADGEKTYQRLLDLVDALLVANKNKPLDPNQLTTVMQIQQDMEKIWGGVERLMKQARLIFVKSTQMFDRDDAVGMEQGVKELKALLQRRELKNYPAQLSELHRWIGQLEPLVLRCKTRLELAKKKLVLTGTTLSEVWEQVPLDLRVSVFGHQAGSLLDVRFVKPVRIAILNGKAYRVGDSVEGEGVRVEKIWPHGVQVSLRDETRDVGIRQ